MPRTPSTFRRPPVGIYCRIEVSCERCFFSLATSIAFSAIRTYNSMRYAPSGARRTEMRRQKFALAGPTKKNPTFGDFLYSRFEGIYVLVYVHIIVH